MTTPDAINAVARRMADVGDRVIKATADAERVIRDIRIADDAALDADMHHTEASDAALKAASALKDAAFSVQITSAYVSEDIKAEALRDYRAAQVAFDAAAATLAEAATLNRFAEVNAENATDAADRVLKNLETSLKALLKWCRATEAVVDAAEAVSTVTGTSEEAAADATYYSLGVADDAQQAIDRLRHFTI